MKACNLKNENPVHVFLLNFAKLLGMKTYFAEHFKQVLLDQRNVITDNYYLISDTSVFF